MRTPFAATERKKSFLQDKVENGEILVQHVPGTDNVADLQTKNLSATQTWYHIAQLGLEERLARSIFLSGDALPAMCTLFVCMKGLFSASADDPWTLLKGLSLGIRRTRESQSQVRRGQNPRNSEFPSAVCFAVPNDGR